MQLAIELPDKTNAMIESYSQEIGIEKNFFTKKINLLEIRNWKLEIGKLNLLYLYYNS